MSRPPLPGPPPLWLMKLTCASAIAAIFGARLRSNSVEVTSRSFLSTMLRKPEPVKTRWNTRSTAGSFSMIAAARSATSSVCLSVVPGGMPMRTRDEVEVERRLERHRQGREQHDLDDEGAEARRRPSRSGDRGPATSTARKKPGCARAIGLGLVGIEAPAAGAEIFAHHLARGVRLDAVRAQEIGRDQRRDHARDEQAHQHRDDDGVAEALEELARDAGHQRDRQEHRDDRHGRRDAPRGRSRRRRPSTPDRRSCPCACGGRYSRSRRSRRRPARRRPGSSPAAT